MADQIKFTEEELKSITDLQVSYNQITMAMGQIAISRLNLDERETAIKSTLLDTRNKEEEIAKSFTEKYGKGSLDINTGEFTPEPEEEASEDTPQK
tara:strand:- start:2332 stop:2619 length:288 start_codon:yes stop_codon:yes gene_type:complete